MTTVAQVGVRGFGRIHLQRIDRLAGLGRIDLVATADPGGPPEDRDLPWHDGLEALLGQHDVDIVSIATPIGTHAALSTAAMAAGADVMLEKPPVPSLPEFLAAAAHRQGDREGAAGRVPEPRVRRRPAPGPPSPGRPPGPPAGATLTSKRVASASPTE